ncbi:MAG: hypothetical protein A2431_00370 [Candidatus Zambryskibacteria bacterium RIFOXYC1_FULL_39_10]|uniref:Uncharacterized protein n=1 Tax=Candidatus Zambryskibacteria bacterium RIFOXYC1_FULL_39_10 TaxID=1802779 RepID=A0A1G2UZI1_9BACT|nr:MAG: hypothetical protein A2431_00370 [Candidatus Zambryskibacteria bacterium RIFOXYC1_FULL_39_10]OHB16001.1 MAG: hypothetical protein A2605_03910 [Candidatus Zambryskibacteria bacterium RIFOXYD1_FULL_39_35]
MNLQKELKNIKNLKNKGELLKALELFDRIYNQLTKELSLKSKNLKVITTKEAGAKGGKIVIKKYGKEHMASIGRLGASKRWGK